MCLLGGNHKHNLSCKLFTTNLSRQDLIDLIWKQGFKADVTEDEGSSYVRITSFESLPDTVKELIKASLPPVVKVSFVVKCGSIPRPKVLDKK